MVKRVVPVGKPMPREPWRPHPKAWHVWTAVAAMLGALVYCGYCSSPGIGPGPFGVNDTVGRLLFSIGIANQETLDRYPMSGAYGEKFEVQVGYHGFVFPDSPPAYWWDLHEIADGRALEVTGDGFDAPLSQGATRAIPRVQLVGVYSAPGLRCYRQVGSTLLLVKVDPPGQWIDLYRDDLARSQYGADRLIVPLAQSMFRTGELRWVETFGEYLVRHGDQGAGAALRRYAHGRFTRAEEAVNAADGVSTRQVQQSARGILKTAAVPLRPDQIQHWPDPGP